VIHKITTFSPTDLFFRNMGVGRFFSRLALGDFSRGEPKVKLFFSHSKNFCWNFQNPGWGLGPPFRRSCLENELICVFLTCWNFYWMKICSIAKSAADSLLVRRSSATKDASSRLCLTDGRTRCLNVTGMVPSEKIRPWVSGLQPESPPVLCRNGHAKTSERNDERWS